MRRKRDSKRRWKARARMGQQIPREVIENLGLNDMGNWECASEYTEFYRLIYADRVPASAQREKNT